LLERRAKRKNDTVILKGMTGGDASRVVGRRLKKEKN